MATYLDRILAAHRVSAEEDGRDLSTLQERAGAAAPARGFAAALRRSPGVALIAEIKRASPSKGPLAPDLDPAGLAAAYEAGGAAAISVLTDAEFFSGSPEDLIQARSSVSLPVLRKDFTVGPADVLDARIMGADAVLLIAAALSDAELAELSALAKSVGVDTLVEVHDEAEAERAAAAGAEVIGVNQRDLVTFEVDTDRAVRVARVLAGQATLVAESGIRDGDDVRRLAAAGFDAVLVGETLVLAQEPGAAAAELADAGRAASGERRAGAGSRASGPARRLSRPGRYGA